MFVDEIEDLIIVPCLANTIRPDESLYDYENKELVKLTNRKYSNYYNSSKWLERLRHKIPEGVILEAILDEKIFDIKPKGGSYYL